MTRYWYAYTKESLLSGKGRAIHQVISQPTQLLPLLTTAQAQYQNIASQHPAYPVPAETFIATAISGLASHAIPPSQATAFSSIGQIMALFEDLAIEQVAINIFNGRVVSLYEESGAEKIARGFSQGELLYLPRDVIRLYASETLTQLPGIVAFLLSRSRAERKAFADYLRSGASPHISDEAKIVIADSRPVLRTWEREARLENEYRNASL